MRSHVRETAALLTLLRTGERSQAEYAERVEEAGSAITVLAEEHASSLLEPDTGPAQADVENWLSIGLGLVTVLDAHYPENLRRAHDRPLLLFVAGRLHPADSKSIAVIGGRKPSRSGLQTAVSIARHLSAEGFVVTSGLAAGIDTAAHTAALEAGGRTVAVVGTGVNRCYPPQNAQLQRRISQAGAVVSQFWPDSPPSRQSFPMRNAVMSAISLATVIVEASEASGTRIQARRSLQQGRPVFLLEPLVEQRAWARELAGSPGTHVVAAPGEITPIVERLRDPGALIS